MKGVLWPLGATMLVQAMVAMAISVVPVLSPVLGAHYGVAPSLIGIYSSLVFVGAISFTLLGGLLVRRFGAVRCSQAALTIAGAALAATAIGPLAGVIVFGVITGMGYGLATPGASHILARVTPTHRRGVVFSMKQSAVPLGGLLAGLIAPIVAAGFGWRAAIISMACLVVAVVLVIRPLRARLDDDRDPDFPITMRSPFTAVANVLRDPRLRGLAIATFAYAAMQSSIFSIFTAYLVEVGGLALITAGQAFAALQAAGVIARIVFGWLSDKLVPARYLLAGIGMAMAAVGIAVAQVNASWPIGAVFALAALLGFAAAGWPGIYLAEIVRVVPPDQVSTATGGTVAFSFLGVVVGPALFSTIVTTSGSYALAFYTFSTVAAVVGAMLWALSRNRQASHGDGQNHFPPSDTQ